MASLTLSTASVLSPRLKPSDPPVAGEFSDVGQKSPRSGPARDYVSDDRKPENGSESGVNCRFPPEGIRGSAHTVVRASGYGIDEGYLSNYVDELLIMCQVESEEGVKKAEEISAVDGVDCVQMGPLDLSASMGYLWDPGHKKVREMMRVSEKGVLKGGAYLGGFAMPHDGPIDLKARGYRMVSGTVDVGLFRSAAVDDVRKFKMSLIQGSDDEAEDGKDGDDKYWSE